MSVKTGDGYLEDQEQGSEDGSPRGVNISPSSMVDSIADWSLEQVVEHLRKKELENKDSNNSSRPVFVTCRSSIKLLPAVIGELATNFGVGNSQMCRWMSYHAIAIANYDVLVNRMSSLYLGIRKTAVSKDDSDTVDFMNCLGAYSPRITGDRATMYQMYESWVALRFKDLAEICGVPKYYMVQLFLLKSALSGDTDYVKGALPRLSEEIYRWDRWMSIRINFLEQLSKKGLV